MTITHRLGEHGLTRAKYKCDICGTINFWQEGWSAYSSMNHHDFCPNDVPHACSDKCGEELLIKIKKRDFVLPVLAIRGSGDMCVKTPRRGY